jgi:hypothetical protein
MTNKFEEMHFMVQKGTANKFRQIMKKAKLSSNDLFEEMVATHAFGLRLDPKVQKDKR